jgi:hypothetical protein
MMKKSNLKTLVLLTISLVFATQCNNIMISKHWENFTTSFKETITTPLLVGNSVVTLILAGLLGYVMYENKQQDKKLKIFHKELNTKMPQNAENQAA